MGPAGTPLDHAEIIARLRLIRSENAGPQPHHRGVIAGGCGGRGGRTVGLVDHRPPGRRAWPRGHGGAGLPLDPRCRGSNQLLRDGAHLIETGDDIVAVVARLGGRHVKAPLGASFDGFEPRPPSPETLAAARREVIEFLDATPTAVDEIIRRCQFSAPVVLTVLLEAELAGTVERHPGNMVARRFTPRSGT